MRDHPLFSKPALFLAPLAGLTHAPYRRLLSEFGGYSALYSEMLSSNPLLTEDLNNSTYTKRRASEGKVVYQLQINRTDPIEKIVRRLKENINPWALDLNLGCPAPSARRRRTGSALFEHPKEIQEVLTRIRSEWDGILSVKTRLGSTKTDNWLSYYQELIPHFEAANLNWFTVHARFWEDGRKRLIKSSAYKELTNSTAIPLIGNGEITSPTQLNHPNYETLSGVMIGRMAIVKPWIFQQFSQPDFDVEAIDYAHVWDKLYHYIMEDFIEVKAIGRLKQFTSYYCQNFTYGHSLYAKVLPCTSPQEVRDVALSFLSKSPSLVKNISILEL